MLTLVSRAVKNTVNLILHRKGDKPVIIAGYSAAADARADAPMAANIWGGEEYSVKDTRRANSNTLDGGHGAGKTGWKHR